METSKVTSAGYSRRLRDGENKTSNRISCTVAIVNVEEQQSTSRPNYTESRVTERLRSTFYWFHLLLHEEPVDGLLFPDELDNQSVQVDKQSPTETTGNAAEHTHTHTQ